MARHPYAKDYRIIEDVDEKGRLKTSVEYKGPDYRVKAGPGCIRRLIAVTAAGWICFVAAMIPPSAAMHTLRVSLIFVFAAIPLFLTTQTVLFLKGLMKKDAQTGVIVKRKEYELFTNRFPAQTFFVFLLSLFALAGEITVLIAGKGRMPGDAVFLAGTAGLCAAGLADFKLLRGIEAFEEAKGPHETVSN